MEGNEARLQLSFVSHGRVLRAFYEILERPESYRPRLFALLEL